MIEIPSYIKKLINNGARKQLRVEFSTGTQRTLRNKDIISESLTFDESICDPNNLKFGICEKAGISFKAVNCGNIKGNTIRVFLDIENPNVKTLIANPNDVVDRYGTKYKIPTDSYVIDYPQNQLITHSFTKVVDFIEVSKKYGIVFDANLQNSDFLEKVIEYKIEVEYDDGSIYTENSNEFVFPKDGIAKITLNCKIMANNSMYPYTKSVIFKLSGVFCYLMNSSLLCESDEGTDGWIYPIPLGVFVVDSCEKDASGQRTIKAYSKLPIDNIIETNPIIWFLTNGKWTSSKKLWIPLVPVSDSVIGLHSEATTPLPQYEENIGNSYNKTTSSKSEVEITTPEGKINISIRGKSALFRPYRGNTTVRHVGFVNYDLNYLPITTRRENYVREEIDSFIRGYLPDNDFGSNPNLWDNLSTYENDAYMHDVKTFSDVEQAINSISVLPKEYTILPNVPIVYTTNKETATYTTYSKVHNIEKTLMNGKHHFSGYWHTKVSSDDGKYYKNCSMTKIFFPTEVVMTFTSNDESVVRSRTKTLEIQPFEEYAIYIAQTSYDVEGDSSVSSVKVSYEVGHPNNITFETINTAKEPLPMFMIQQNATISDTYKNASGTVAKKTFYYSKDSFFKNLSNVEIMNSFWELSGKIGKASRYGGLENAISSVNVALYSKRDYINYTEADEGMAFYAYATYTDSDGNEYNSRYESFPENDNKYDLSANPILAQVYAYGGESGISDCLGIFVDNSTMVYQLAYGKHSLDLDAEGKPYVEVGDVAYIQSDDGMIPIIVTSRNLRGIQALRDTFDGK